MRNAPHPWLRDPSTPVDKKGYAIIRDARGSPVAFVEKTLDRETTDKICGILVAAPSLLDAVREIAFAGEDVEDWGDKEWSRWRKKHGPALAIALGMMP